MDIKSNKDCFVYLLQCGIRGISPTKLKDKNINLKEIFDLAVEHRVENIIYLALSGIESFKKSAANKIMEELYMHAVAREAKQELESKRIMDAFEDAGIVHMPLKGFIIKNLYPSPDLRQSTDFDIWVPEKFNRRSYEVMTKLGYECDEAHIGYGMHDEYKLGDLMIAEVHKNLMAPEFPKWCRLCDELIENIKLTEGYHYRYEFSKEDYYLYMQLHTIKHLKFSSTGVKSVLDIWIYLNQYNDVLDWDYINKMLDKGNITEIDRNLRDLSRYWFDDTELPSELIGKLSDFIISNGAFGTYEQYLSGRKTDENAFHKFYLMFFKPYSEMALKYPVLKKAPFLLPIMWIYRALNAVFRKKGAAVIPAGKNCAVDEEYMNELSKFKKEIGL